MVAMSSDYKACSATNRMYDARLVSLSLLPVTLHFKCALHECSMCTMCTWYIYVCI